MANCVKIMENWIYTQAFNGKRYFKLPDGIAYIKVSAEYYEKDDLCIPPFIQLLLNTFGLQVEEYFEIQ